eukprot:640349-Amphidinium_carterae.1
MDVATHSDSHPTLAGRACQHPRRSSVSRFSSGAKPPTSPVTCPPKTHARTNSHERERRAMRRSESERAEVSAVSES